MIGDEKLEVVPEFCYLRDILSADCGCELASITRCKCAWAKFRQLLPLLANRHLSLLTRYICLPTNRAYPLHTYLS